MVDAADLKSVVREGVPVRVWPGALKGGQCPPFIMIGFLYPWRRVPSILPRNASMLLVVMEILHL